MLVVYSHGILARTTYRKSTQSRNNSLMADMKPRVEESFMPFPELPKTAVAATDIKALY